MSARWAPRTLIGWIGGSAAIVVVVASVFVRQIGPADPAADVTEQRAAVARFHSLVRDERWPEVQALMTEPPVRDPDRFVAMMRAQVQANGKVVTIRTGEIRLLRSRTVPMLEVRETVTTTNGRFETVSYYARRGGRWLFAFSAPDD